MLYHNDVGDAIEVPARLYSSAVACLDDAFNLTDARGVAFMVYGL